MAKKILMLVGDFVEDYEVMVPFQALMALGFEVHAVCPDKKAGDKVATAVHDFTEFQTYVEIRGHDFVLNASFANVNAADYDGLYVCGGRAPEYIRLNSKVIDITKHFFEKNKPVAAICHGSQVLTAADVLRGRTLTTFSAVAPDITAVGGIYKAVASTEAITDGNLVTSPGWPGHPAVLKAYLKLFGVTVAGV